MLPSSTTLFIAHHNTPLHQIGEEVEGVHVRVSLEDTLRAPLARTEGIRMYHWHRLVSKMYESDEKDKLLNVGVLGFADETSAIDQLSNREKMTEILRRRLEINGEMVHPDKDEFMAAGKMREGDELQAIGAGLKNKVRLLGGWIDMDGGATEDTKRRLQAAAKAWGIIRRQMMRLSLDLKTKGRIVEAIVCSTRFYVAEVRTHSYASTEKYNISLNKVVRAICWSTSQMDLTTTGKEGIAMQDLYNSCGLKPAKVYLESRCLQYLGHLGRYPDTRIERQMLSARIEGLPEELTVQCSRRTTVRHEFARLLTEFIGYVHSRSGLPAPNREEAMKLWPSYAEKKLRSEGPRIDDRHGTWWKHWLKKYSTFLERRY